MGELGAGNFGVLDSKAVMVHGTKQVVYLPHTHVEPGESADTFWLNLQPQRFRSIAKMLSAYVDAGKKGKKGVSFEKGSIGNKFIKRIKKYKQIAVKSKFNVNGKRLMTRNKKDRAAQLVCDVVSVPLPSVEGVQGIAVSMKLTSSVNGRQPLWVLINPEVMHFLAWSLKHFEDRESDDEGDDVSDDTADDEGSEPDAGADAPDAVAPASPPNEVVEEPIVAAQASPPAAAAALPPPPSP